MFFWEPPFKKQTTCQVEGMYQST